jgi:hypothetical protein
MPCNTLQREAVVAVYAREKPGVNENNCGKTGIREGREGGKYGQEGGKKQANFLLLKHLSDTSR